MRPRALLVVLLLAALLPAQIALAAKAYRGARFVGLAGAGVVVMPEEVQLYELTAGRTLEPQAEWTQSARVAIDGVLLDELKGMGIPAGRYRGPGDDPARQRLHRQLGLLHGVVARTIQANYLEEKNRLPSMGDRFDWSLGPDAAALAEDGAGFALWTMFGDAYSSGGRQAMNVMVAIFGGTMVYGRQVAMASLVDLRTGDVVWFARRSVSGGGAADLRTPEGARHAVRDLLEDLRR
ncbi:MAG: hypothetical protein ACRELS_17765 [Candidatus Rokuibacteriota bacterium]